ncbi:MAG: serine/threonine-protein kinase [Thermoanaerobaculia bacterium]
MIRELALFDELADLEEEERRRRLTAIERDDPALARAVERLFEADRLSSGVLDQATGSIAAAPSDATGEAPDPQHPPFAMLGAWRLGALLGVGGMGEVWSGERQEGGFAQRAAIKLVRAGMASRQVVARFLLERQVLARLEHPAIARILDGGLTPDGRPWFAMELVDGVPLLDYVQRRRPPLRDRLQLFLRIAEPVELAHRRLVVHRDIKPGNVLVEPGGAPRLLDFGLAKLLEEEAAEGATRTELRALTPAYAAPEQVLGEPVSTATDVYSLGVLLYQLLTGELPHRRSSPSNAGLAREVLHETLERASLRVERRALESGESRAEARAAARPLAGDLDVILARAMQREPERRYPSVAAFALDVERHLAGLPIAARADSVGYRASKFVRRNWFAVAATVAVLLSLVTGLAISIRQTARANAAAEAARTEAQRAERVKRFLVSVFEQADPTRTMGAEMPARQILGEGAQRLEHELADEPEVRAELFDTVSRIQSSLGLLDEALASAERSAMERTRLLGAASPATAESLTTVGYAQLAQGRQAEAETTIADALGRFDAAGETTSTRYARALSARAQLRMMNGDLSGARSDETRVHELFAAALGPDDSETLEHLSNLAVIETRRAPSPRRRGSSAASSRRWRRTSPGIRRSARGRAESGDGARHGRRERGGPAALRARRRRPAEDLRRRSSALAEALVVPASASRAPGSRGGCARGAGGGARRSTHRSITPSSRRSTTTRGLSSSTSAASRPSAPSGRSVAPGSAATSVPTPS